MPFFKRWLVCTPIADPKDDLLEAPFAGEATVEPRIGAVFRGRSWSELRTLEDFVGFGPDGRPGPKTISYAFTWLHVATETDTVLWFASDDGGRLFLDGKSIFLHHVHETAERDRYSVPVHLTAGAHPLLVKVDNGVNLCGFYLRLAHADGGIAREIRPSLGKSDPQLAASALAMPGLFTLAELRTNLPPLPSPVVGFGAAKDLELFAYEGLSEDKPGFPLFIDVPQARPVNPHPGARGILGVHPLSENVPARIYFRATVPAAASKLSVRVSEEAYAAQGHADFMLRLGVFTDDLAWLVERVIGPDADADAKHWRTIAMPLDRWAGQDALFVIECAAGGAEPWNFEHAFFDEIALR